MKKNILILLGILGLFILPGAVPTYTGTFTEKSFALEQTVFSDPTLQQLLDENQRDQGYLVLFSVSDGDTRAKTSVGQGLTLKSAWNRAENRAAQTCKNDKRKAVWVKVDIAYASDTLAKTEAQKQIPAAAGSFQQGIMFGDQAEYSLLGIQLNTGGAIDYETQTVSLSQLNQVFSQQGLTPLKKLPDSWTIFSTKGYLCQEDGTIVSLEEDGRNVGIRPSSSDPDSLTQLVKKSAGYLADMVEEDGHFFYGTYAATGEELPGNSVLRHAGSTWSLLCAYEQLQDPSLLEKAKKALDYMASHYTVMQDSQTAFLEERGADELKLGGNALAVVALAEYMDCTGDMEYLSLAKQLGNGILSMQQKDGGFIHVLHAHDFTLKDQVRTVYYDGEAVFGLMKLYSLTGEKKWLDSAKKAVDYLILQHYEEHGDHWISYAMDQLIQIDASDDYLTFALANGQQNLEAIYRRRALDPAGMENLMCVRSIVDTVKKKNPLLPALQQWDETFLEQAITYRASYMQESFFYPEIAIYMAAPRGVMGSFFVREDGYRVRIDDIQHTISGYLLYLEYQSQPRASSQETAAPLRLKLG